MKINTAIILFVLLVGTPGAAGAATRGPAAAQAEMRVVPSSVPLNPPQSPELKAARETVVKDEQTRLGDLLKAGEASQELLSDEFGELRRTYTLDWHQGRFILRNKDRHGSFFAMDENYNIFRMYDEEVDYKKMLSGVAGLKKYLQFHNIDLICVPLPLANELASAEIFPEYRNFYSLDYLKVICTMLDNGIEVVDLLPELKRCARGYKLMYYYHLFDWHPHEGAVDVASDAVAARIARYGFQADKKRVFTKQYVENTGWLACPDNTFKIEDVNREPEILLDGKMFTPPVSGGPLLVMGNALACTPAAGKQSFAKFLAMKTGLMVAYLHGNGNGLFQVTAKQILYEEEKFLRGVKAVILVTGINYFYDSCDVWEKRGELLAMSELKKVEFVKNESLVSDSPAVPEDRFVAALRRSGTAPCWVLLKDKEKSRIAVTLPEHVYSAIQKGSGQFGIGFDYHNISAPESYFRIFDKEEKRGSRSGQEFFLLPSAKAERIVVIEAYHPNTLGRSVIMGIDKVRIYY